VKLPILELQKWKQGNMKLIIIGVDHKIQGSSEELKRLVTGITETESVKVIGEEANGEAETFVQQIAEERNIPWIQIDMTDQQRREFGIHEKLDTRMEHSSPFESSTGIISDEQWASAFDENGQVIQKRVYFEKEDGIREHFWLDRISEVATDGTAIIVCGALHARPLAKKAQQRGHVTQLLFDPERLSELWLSENPIAM
jgi:hypothetical protein